MTTITNSDLSGVDHYVDLWVARNNLDLMDEFMDEFMDRDTAEACVDCWIDDELAIVHDAYDMYGWDPEAEMEPVDAPNELVHRGFGLQMFRHAVEGYFDTREGEGTIGLFIQYLKRAVLDSEDAILAVTNECCIHCAEGVLRNDAERAQPDPIAEAEQSEVDRKFFRLVEGLNE